jgi:hypothetical protein
MITFGIITNKGHHKTQQHARLEAMLWSIERDNKIPDFEVLIVGDYKVYDDEYHDKVRCIPFDDSVKPGWISRKKNIVTQEAKGDVIVYMHDYVCLDKDWYEGWQNFGWDWDLAMNVILNKDGTRFRDWCVFQYDGNKGLNGIWPCNLSKCPDVFLSPYLPDYSYNRTENLYISGTYWLAKREVMLAEPLDEEFVWGQHEDIEWSFRVLPKYKYVMNTQSHVHLLHQKDPVWRALP